MNFFRSIQQLLVLLIVASHAIAQESILKENSPLEASACRDFANQLSKAIETGDVATCSRLYDESTIIDHVFDGLDFGQNDRQKTIADWKQRFLSVHAAFQSLIVECANGGSFRLVSVNPRASRGQIIMRVLDSQGDLSYQTYHLAKQDGGGLVVDGVNNLGGGPSPFDTVRTMVAHFTPFDGPDGKIRSDVPNADALTMDKRVLYAMGQEFLKKSFRNVCLLYPRLSKDLQEDGYAIQLTLRASIEAPPDAEMSEKQLIDFSQSLIDMYRGKFPGDTNIELLAVTHYMNTKQHALAIAAIDAIDKEVGTDPYLDSLRAGVHSRAKEYAIASKLAENALAKVPDISGVYIVAADIAIHRDDDSRALKILDDAYRRFGLVPDINAEMDPSVSKFMNSRAYLEWHAKKKRGTETPK